MKAKLLKKIRKRFKWYYRNSDNIPVVIDTVLKSVRIYSFDNCLTIMNNKKEDIEISEEEYIHRTFRINIFKEFGFSYMYYCALKNFRKSLLKTNNKN